MTPLSPEVVHGWAAARSIARRLPAPVSDHGGWRVDTASETEEARYFFAAPGTAIRDLTRTIARPRVFLKLCGSRDEMAALLPPGWAIEMGTWMMSGAPVALPMVPVGYRLEIAAEANRWEARMVDSDGMLAASGFAALSGGVFAYDRIVTAQAHWRRGLGRVVMAALGERAPADAIHVLAATRMGRALYESIGWQVRSDYTTAFIPAVA